VRVATTAYPGGLHGLGEWSGVGEDKLRHCLGASYPNGRQLNIFPMPAQREHGATQKSSHEKLLTFLMLPYRLHKTRFPGQVLVVLGGINNVPSDVRPRRDPSPPPTPIARALAGARPTKIQPSVPPHFFQRAAQLFFFGPRFLSTFKVGFCPLFSMPFGSGNVARLKRFPLVASCSRPGKRQYFTQFP